MVAKPKKAPKSEPARTAPDVVVDLAEEVGAMLGFDVTNLSHYRRAIEPTFTEIELKREDGKAPFRATIRDNLSFTELNELPRGVAVTFEAMWPKIARYVVAWNVRAENLETGEVVDVPPPAEVGPDVFQVLSPQEAAWIILRIRTAHLGGDEQKKGASSPEPTDEPSPDETSDER